ncbi:MAG: NADP-dependent oxidoreductase, partial [Rhizobacter sp.]|nr:NADP-dependent oxidoreductase [Rhizobacter sp.]
MAAPTVNRQWLLRRRPQGPATVADFEYRETQVPGAHDLAPGELLLRNRAFLCAPTMRNWMEPPGNSLYPSLPIGEPVMAPAGCEVVASARAGVAVGSLVTSFTSWQDFTRVGAGHAVTPVPAGLSLTEAMGVLGLNTLTAYFGLLRVGRPAAGETLVVSGAAGSTGAIAAQIGKLKGCRVIGIAGGASKCAWLTDELGLDGAVDYKAGNVEGQLRALCPQGVDVFFDNVGGEILQAAVEVMARKGRIVLCGQIATYNNGGPAPGPRNMMRLVYGSITMQGFLQGDY